MAISDTNAAAYVAALLLDLPEEEEEEEERSLMTLAGTQGGFDTIPLPFTSYCLDLRLDD